MVLSCSLDRNIFFSLLILPSSLCLFICIKLAISLRLQGVTLFRKCLMELRNPILHGHRAKHSREALYVGSVCSPVVVGLCLLLTDAGGWGWPLAWLQGLPMTSGTLVGRTIVWLAVRPDQGSGVDRTLHGVHPLMLSG